MAHTGVGYAAAWGVAVMVSDASVGAPLLVGCFTGLLATCVLLVPRPLRGRFQSATRPWRRVLGTLLVGFSLAAALWSSLGVPPVRWLLVSGHALRWYLYGVETLELRKEDAQKMPRPSAATRTRRSLLWITGGAIPLAMLVAGPVLPLLWFSFVLTFFCQWLLSVEHAIHPG